MNTKWAWPDAGNSTLREQTEACLNSETEEKTAVNQGYIKMLSI